MITNTFKEKILSLLSADPDQLVSKQQKNIKAKVIEWNSSFILFGAGELGRKTAETLLRLGKKPVAFADNNSKLNGTNINGIPVIIPEKALSMYPDALFLITVFTNSPVVEQLQRMGAKAITFAELAWCYPNDFLPFCFLDLPHKIFDASEDVVSGLEIWNDDESRVEYIAQIEWRLSLDSSKLPVHSQPKEIYFPKDLFNFSKESSCSF